MIKNMKLIEKNNLNKNLLYLMLQKINEIVNHLAKFSENYIKEYQNLLL